MLTLTELLNHFARLDAVQGDELPQYEKSVRNLTQRYNLPIADQRGRVFVYDEDGAAAIRLAQIVYDFGVDRIALETLTRFLSSTHLVFRPKPGNQPTMIGEAVRRVREGETFSLHLLMGIDRRFRCEFDWPKEQASERVRNAVAAAGRGDLPELSRLTLRASKLIADTLQAFKG